MDTYKLRVRVGAHEFEAEGPRDDVSAQFEAWKTLIQALPPTAAANPKDDCNTGKGSTPASGEERQNASPSDKAAFLDLFQFDDKRSLITLRARPLGENAEADAILLVAYGYREINGQESVLSAQLGASLRESGVTLDRVDRVVAADLRAGYLLHAGGRAKATRYRLTTTGHARAENLARELFAKLV